MTPEERLRDDLERVKFCPHMDWQTNACSACRTYRLKVALEAAWAKSDSRREEANRWAAKFGEQQARAERAEADAREARAEAAFSRAAENAIGTQNIAYRASLARVRALCAEQMGCDHLIRASDIRATIDGGAE